MKSVRLTAKLLHWHQQLCLNMRNIQKLMRAQEVRNQAGKLVAAHPAILLTKHKSTKNLKSDQFLHRLACKLATACARGTNVKTLKSIPEKTGILSRDKYEPGHSISTDQYVVKTPGCLKKGYGREALHNCYRGEAIFQDSESGLI